MKKEQILDLLKDTVLTLKDKSKELSKNDLLYKAWKEQNKRVAEEVKKLDSCDMLWISDEYGKWFKQHILPEVDKFRNNLGSEWVPSLDSNP